MELMRTTLGCIPCFFRQAETAAKLAGADTKTSKKILDEIAGLIPAISLTERPPQIGEKVYEIVKRAAGCNDPFEKIKRLHNEEVLSMYGQLRQRIQQSPEPLLMSVKFAAAGNVIDYGVPGEFDLRSEMDNIVDKGFTVFDYEDFKQSINSADNILYIGDNAGEIVFDKLLIEQLDKDVVYAVRG
ncbi:MAG TPA: DUF89 family protein, partial [Candidatus Omnitrophica bacterium]|nr:DUF89 family protein [Candidatus Omnitrophota bacterium]